MCGKLANNRRLAFLALIALGLVAVLAVMQWHNHAYLSPVKIDKSGLPVSSSSVARAGQNINLPGALHAGSAKGVPAVTQPGTTSNSISAVVGQANAGTSNAQVAGILDFTSASNAFLRIRELIDQRKYPEALKAAEDLLAMNIPADIRERSLLERARMLAVLERKEEAVAVLAQLLDSAKDANVLHEVLAKFFILNRDMGSLGNQIATMEQRLASDPANTRLVEVLAYMYQYSQATDKETKLREYLANKGEDIGNLKRLSAIYEAAGQAASFTNMQVRLANADPARAVVYLLAKARSDAVRGDVAAAQQSCDDVLKAAGQDNAAKFSVSRVYQQIGSFDKAIELIEQCRSVAKDDNDKQYCTIEICRTKVKAGSLDRQSVAVLEDLAANGVNRAIRNIASGLLEHIRGKGNQ